MNYFEWSRRGQYNGNKAEAAWRFAEKQKDEQITKLETLLKEALKFIDCCRLEHNKNCEIPMMVPDLFEIKSPTIIKHAPGQLAILIKEDVQKIRKQTAEEIIEIINDLRGKPPLQGIHEYNLGVGKAFETLEARIQKKYLEGK